MDNWNFLRDKLDFSDPDKFYFMELMQRKKDNPDFPSNNKMVKCYFVNSLDYYDTIESEVKKLSDCTGARVYILLNRRSYKKCILNILKDAAQLAIDNNYEHLPKLISSVCGKYSDEPDKNWIIDIDYNDRELINKVSETVNILEPFGNKIKFEVPTLHGVHLITSPFNCQQFSQIYPNIDIHKDNPTLLYFKHDER